MSDPGRRLKSFLAELKRRRVYASAEEGHWEEILDLLADLDREIGVFVVDLAADPILDPIRNDPRYRAFLASVGLAEYWREAGPAVGGR